MKKSKALIFLSLILVSLWGNGCHKALVYSRDKDMDPVYKDYKASTVDTYKALKESLTALGYSIASEDESQGVIKTKWISTKATSHYLDLFDRKDYGTVGAYYRITAKVEDKSSKTGVSIFSTTRSIISGRLHSSFRAENKVLNRVDDILRREDLEITNVGVQE